MKIAIVSFWNSQDNYGQVLQCFAMQNILKKLGHDPYHIKHDGEFFRQDKRSLLIHLTRLVLSGQIIKKISEKIRQRCLQNNVEKGNIDRGFDSFRDKYLTWSKKFYTLQSLRQNPPMADIYITGSDQVWCRPSPIMFLDFGDEKIKRIAYAPSFGGHYDKSVSGKKKYCQLLKNIDIITVRESNAKAYCNELGYKNIEVVPDPTLLLPPDVYRKIEVKPKSSDYVLIYLLGNPIDYNIEDLYAWAASLNLKVVYISSQGRIDGKEKKYPNVDEWIGYIDCAKYVITNSFHGMVFSIILNKQFSIIPLSRGHKGMNDRIFTVLEQYNLTNQIFRNISDIGSKIDYNKINDDLARNRQFYTDKLSRWITSIC